MRALLIAICVLFTFHVMAQRSCFSAESLNGASIAPHSAVHNKILTDVIQYRSNGNVSFKEKITVGTIIQIPVVVHILYNAPAQNVSDEQVKSQIDALNRDFRKRNFDTANIPERFTSLAADVEIEFQLAIVGPQGSATNGIIRKQTAVKEWAMDDKIKFSAQGGDDAWDSKSYLNIWVGNIQKTLGYASAINGPVEKDGIVISNTAFGTIGIAGTYNMGRTLVHETGHWLGLKHIWGDAPCGDDGVDDTPVQAGFTTGCPSGFRATCGSSLGDMYMNYMDFTNDACMCIFTKGQKDKMRSAFLENGFRNALLNSKGLDASSITNTPVSETQSPGSGLIGNNMKNLTSEALLYPNPATSECTLKLSDESWIGKEIKIINISGVVLQTVRISTVSQVISVSTLPQGVYFLVMEKADKKLYLKFLKTNAIH